MAEFRKCFDNLDTEKRGVITIDDLRNYMLKMHYKETFLQKWIELFDPEHTGLITYEQYCKTLGLIPRKRTTSKTMPTDSSQPSISSNSTSPQSVESSKEANGDNTAASKQGSQPSESSTTRTQPPSSKEPSFVQDADQKKLCTHIHEEQKIKITIHTVEKCSTDLSPAPPPPPVDGKSVPENSRSNNNKIEDIPRKDAVHHQEESHDEIRGVTNNAKIIPVHQEKLNRRKRKYTDERSEDSASGRSVLTANDGDKIPIDNSKLNATIHQTICSETLIIDQSTLDPVQNLKPNEEMHSSTSSSSVGQLLSLHHQPVKPQEEQSSTEQPHMNASNKSTKKHKKKKKQALEVPEQKTTETGTAEEVHCESTPGLVRSELNDIAMLVDEECLIKASEETVILENYYQQNVTLTTTNTTTNMNMDDGNLENNGQAVKVMAKPKSPLINNNNNNNNTELHFTSLVSPMSPMTSISAMSISIDSGHSGSNDTTLSLVERSTLETDASYTTMSASPQVFDSSSRISTPSSTSTSMMAVESNQPSKWLSSDEVVVVAPQKHGDICAETSHDQKIPKQEGIGKAGKKADKKKKGKTSPDTTESQVVVGTDIPLVDSHPDEFIQKSVIQSYAVHTIKHDFDSVNNDDTVSPAENRETPSEPLIIPRIINSMYTKTHEEFDHEPTEPTALSTKLSEIEVDSAQVVNNQSSKKESKKSKKKHQKINEEINKTVDPDFSTTDNFDQIISIPESTALSIEEEKWRQETSLQAAVEEHFQQTIVLNTSIDEVKIHPTDTTMCEVVGEDLESDTLILPATEIGSTQIVNQASKKESKKSKKKHHKINQEIDKTVDLDFSTTDSFDQMISIPESTAQTVEEAKWQELNLPDCQTSLQAPIAEHIQKTVVNTSVHEIKVPSVDDTAHIVDVQSDISKFPVTEIDSTPIVNQELKKESKKSKKKHQKSNQEIDQTADADFNTSNSFDQIISTPESTAQPVEKAKWQELSSTNSQTPLQAPVEEHFQQTFVLTTSVDEMKVHPMDDTVNDLSLQSGISMLPQTEFDSTTPVGNLPSKKESKKNKKKHQKASVEIDKTVVPDFITTDNFDQMISLPDRSTTPQSSEEVKLQELNFSNYQTSLQVPILKKPSNQITDNISMDEVKLYPMDTTMSDAAAGEDLQSDISPMLQKSIKPTTEAGLKTTSSIEKLSDEIQASSYAATTVITETNEPKASKKSTKPTKSSIQNSVPTKIQGELGDAVNQLLQLHDPELLNTQTTNQPSLLKKSSNKKPKKSLQPTDNSEMKIDQSNAVVNSTVPAFLQNSIDLSSVTAANGDQLPVSSLVDDDIEMKESSTIIPLSTSSLNNSSKPSSKDVSIPGKSKKAKKKNNNSKTPLNTDSKNSMSTESTLLYSSEKAEKSSLSSRQVVKNNSNNVQIPDSGNSTTSKKVSKTPIHPSPEQHISVSKMKVSPPRPKDKKLQLKKQKSKKSKLDNVLHQMNSLNDKTGGKLKKSDGVDDTTTTTNINDKESQENTRKRRFPRSYATQVDPSSIRSARRAAKRRKTDKPAEEKHDDSSEKPDQKKRKRTIKRRRNQIMKKWCIRSSLRESGVIVILLAGRHRGKRVVCLGRHKSSGLLLVTGPYRYNGCPLRRVHPNYVIATKTKIDLSNLSLPNRIHQKEYFARSTSPISRKSRKVNNQKRLEDILEHGVESQKPVYKPSEEKKSDQRFIDEEVRKAIKSHSDSQMLIRYLRSLFSISKHDRPHEMFF